MKSSLEDSRSTRRRVQRSRIIATSSSSTTAANNTVSSSSPGAKQDEDEEEDAGGIAGTNNTNRSGSFATTEPTTPQEVATEQELISHTAGWNPHDSFSEEPFLPPAIPHAGSWEESHSFDSSHHPRPHHQRDQRKNYDTTTPTLVDEEDAEEEEEEGRDAGLEHEEEDEEDEELASASRGATTEEFLSLQPQLSSSSSSRLRRTPGASQMHQSASAGSPQQRQTPQQWRSFASPGEGEREGEDQSTSGGEPVEHAAASSSHHTNITTRPPLAPSGGTTSTTAGGGETPIAVTTARLADVRGPFAFTPWAKQQRQQQQQQRQQQQQTPSSNAAATPSSATQSGSNSSGGGNNNGTAGGRAFSPNILRLTEDIGNLLQEDEDDDDYAIEIPSVFRGGQQQQGVSTGGTVGLTAGGGRGTSSSSNTMGGGRRGGSSDNNTSTGFGGSTTDDGGDWTGSYVFDQNIQHQQHHQAKFGTSGHYHFNSRRGGTVQRPNTSLKDSKARRRSNHHNYHYNQHVGGGGGGGGGGFASGHAAQPQQPQFHPVGSSSFFFPISNTMQPKPRHVSETHPVFEFGKQQHAAPGTPGMVGGEQGSIHFGGAFVPPSKELLHQDHHPQHPHESQSQAMVEPPPPQSQPPPPQQHQQPPPSMFLRPVTSPPGNAAFLSPFQHLTPTPPPQQVMEGAPPTFGMPPSTFGSFQNSSHPPRVVDGSATGLIHPVPSHPFVVYGAPPQGDGPPFMVPHVAGVQYHPSQQDQHHSEMHATAQEFVPMSTRSTTPPFMGTDQRWQPHPVPVPLGFDQPPPGVVDAGNWHHVEAASNYPMSPSSVFNIPPQSYGGDPTGRATMTPSPHFQSWQPPPPLAPPLQTDPAHYGMPPPPQSNTPVEVPQLSRPQSAPSQNAVSAPSPDISQGNRSKKESRRSTRGRKKKPKAAEKSVAIASASNTSSKRKGKDGTRSASVASNVASNEGAADDLAVSVSEDPADLKRAELEESPATRIAFKDFYRAFRLEERHSFQKAEDLAQQVLSDGSLPESIHWRVYLELADLARRSNRYIEARRLYQKVCQLQPFASQGWLEYSKLEEDCGFMNRVSNILHAGLEYCEYSETLLTRAVKHQEKMGNLFSARGILARLKHVGIDKVWRTVLEGALLESRAGHYDMARRVLKYLMHHVPWYGPLYLEAYKLERDQGHPIDAMQIVERGLTTLPRYGPLWFGAFRLYEEMDITERQYHLPRTMVMIERAKCTISKELVWKLHLEAAQMLERTALAFVEESGLDLGFYLSPVRRRLVLTILTCPQNLRWKVWLSAGRMELVVGNVDIAHALFQRAHYCVQQKSKSATVLDCARLAEFKGDVDLARAILAKARSYYGNDWKVWFESVLVEIRNDNHNRGYEIALNGLELHTGSGRLWATLVQLGQYVQGDEIQISALERALSAVPKSGEVWCEGARIHLNPFSCTFDLHRSRRYLHFAARFTPQFGDSFIESIRLEVLSQWLFPIAKYIWKKTKRSFNNTETKNGDLGKYIADVFLAIAVARRNDADNQAKVPETKFREIVSTLRRKLKVDNLRSSIDLTDLRLACTNADPNYGSLWFHCRRLPMYTPRRVIEHAAEDIANEIFKYANIYLAAMIRRMAVLATADQEMPEGAEGVIETNETAIINWENYIDKKLRGATSLQDILTDPPTGLVLLESAIGGSVFITGLSKLNRYRPLASMTLLERRRALFGTDALFP